MRKKKPTTPDHAPMDKLLFDAGRAIRKIHPVISQSTQNRIDALLRDLEVTQQLIDEIRAQRLIGCANA